MSLAGTASEGHIISRHQRWFDIPLRRQGLQATGYQTLKFHINEGYREVEMLSPDEGQWHVIVVSSSFLVILSDCVRTIDDVKLWLPLSACLPEKIQCRLLRDDLRKAAKLMGEKHNSLSILRI